MIPLYVSGILYSYDYTSVYLGCDMGFIKKIFSRDGMTEEQIIKKIKGL